jgi:tRNA modification GTPase
MYADDTIAAIATPPGPGGVGIVRVSGPLAEQIAEKVVSRPNGQAMWTSHRMYYGSVRDTEGRLLDGALAVLMRRPRSFTGEDVLELHCHGSPAVLRQVLARVLGCGARLADPGEFTRRAFLNGRLDLAQAEAVIDVVRARTDAGAAAAVAHMSGSFSEHLGRLRNDLVHLKALLEAQIDFSEEDFAVDPAQLLASLDQCAEAIETLLGTYRRGKILRDGASVTIVGKPNVGKSSLLNALLGEDRAIVTAIAGTTRDVIDEALDFDGFPVVLSDTAGLRDREPADPVERIGVRRTADKISGAQVALIVFDTSQSLDEHDRVAARAASGLSRVIVLNKIDLPARISDSEAKQLAGADPIVRVSAKERIGLGDLRRAVVGLLAGDAVQEHGPLVTRVRHADALTKASRSLHLARQSICDARPADLIAVDVQDAIDHIGAITGEITSEDVLDKIFSEFCIGK